MISLTSEIRVC